MSNLFLLPDGNASSLVLIRSVQLYQGKGVMCRDAQQRVVTWIPVSGHENGCRVRDIMIRLVQEGPRAVQPDWSFLKDEVVVAD